MAEKRDFRRGKLPGKYMARMLYEQNNKKFEREYLKKLERNWTKWKEKNKTTRKAHGFSGSRNLERGVMSNLRSLDSSFF